jgi:hypothetical protein
MGAIAGAGTAQSAVSSAFIAVVRISKRALRRALPHKAARGAKRGRPLRRASGLHRRTLPRRFSILFWNTANKILNYRE